MSQASDDPFVFAGKLLGVLRYGEFTSTYKYAVLLALMDLCVEQHAIGEASTSVTTTQLAARVIELYWPHTWPYQQDLLYQDTSKRHVVVVSSISKWRAKHAPDGESLNRARADRKAFDRLVRQVEWKLVQMPLPKLQRVGDEQSFIYEIGWDDHVRKGEFNDASFDNRILLLPGVAANLIRVSPLLRPLIHREWAAMVARINALEIADLESFLFGGADQVDLTPVRAGLLELQSKRCFYCHSKIVKDPQVDHFIPQARHPDHGLDNLVVAHQRCNGSKSDFLAHGDHLLAWSRRLIDAAAELGAIATDTRWQQDTARTVNIVRTIYAQVPVGVALWRKPRDWAALDAGARDRAFAAMQQATHNCGH